MSRRFQLSASVVGLFLLVGAVWATENLDSAKCPISGEAVDEAASVEFGGGKVFMCCEKCVKAFDAKNADHVTKANHQLVVTKQAKQVGCPFSGQKIADGTTIAVDGADVGFCCGKCKGKVEGAADDEAKLKLVFSEAAFAKGFKVEVAEEAATK